MDIEQLIEDTKPDELLAQMAKFEELKNGGKLLRQPYNEDEEIIEKFPLMEQLSKYEKRKLTETLNRRVADSILTANEKKSIENQDLKNEISKLKSENQDLMGDIQLQEANFD